MELEKQRPYESEDDLLDTLSCILHNLPLHEKVKVWQESWYIRHYKQHCIQHPIRYRTVDIGQCQEIFCFKSFFMNHLPPSLQSFWKFAEIFKSQGKSPVSTPRVANLPPVSMSTVANFATSVAGSVDTSGKFSTGVNETSGKVATGVNKTNSKLAAGVNSTGGK